MDRSGSRPTGSRTHLGTYELGLTRRRVRTLSSIRCDPAIALRDLGADRRRATSNSSIGHRRDPHQDHHPSSVHSSLPPDSGSPDGVWLDNHGIPYWDLCFMRDKGDVGADLYVEDSPENIKSLRSLERGRHHPRQRDEPNARGRTRRPGSRLAISGGDDPEAVLPVARRPSTGPTAAARSRAGLVEAQAEAVVSPGWTTSAASCSRARADDCFVAALASGL